jgi:4-hydroxythreonine-4-phosphate dehydrogenase
MKTKPIIIVAGEPNSIFFEILFKTMHLKKIKSPLILIGSIKLLNLQMRKLNFKKKIRLLDIKDLNNHKLNNKSINLIDIHYNTNVAFDKITHKSREYIKKSFEIAFKIISNDISDKMINGPISKKNFLNKKFLGMTEYICSAFSKKKYAMLIFNKELAVCPITTHLPLKQVVKKINKKLIQEKVSLIHDFYKKKFNIIPKIAVLGLNPHCESNDTYNEDEKIIKPAIKHLSNLSYKVSGPFPADTFFLKNNRKKFNVVLGMYHDQVLTPIKTLFEYDAINITLGLPFIRISPDHGPNEKMLGKNLSNPLSLIKAIEFMDKN